MGARSFLVRGLGAGLVAGLFTFLVAVTVGEPPIERAVSLEQASASGGSTTTATVLPGHDGSDHGTAHHHDDDAGGIGRYTQRTWGLATATVAVGVALGGIMALVSAAVAGRLGRLSVVGSTAVVTAIGFVSYALVPFLKYPAVPPAVGSGETIGERTGYFFGFVLLSVAAAAAAVAAARALAPRLGTYHAVVSCTVGYVVVVAVAAWAMPVVDELGDVPADLLWEFRVGSLLTLAALWGSLGVALTWLLRGLDRPAVATG